MKGVGPLDLSFADNKLSINPNNGQVMQVPKFIPALNLGKVQRYQDKQQVIKEIIEQDKQSKSFLHLKKKQEGQNKTADNQIVSDGELQRDLIIAQKDDNQRSQVKSIFTQLKKNGNNQQSQNKKYQSKSNNYNFYNQSTTNIMKRTASKKRGIDKENLDNEEIIEEETAANSANQYPEKLSRHLQDLAQLESDLKRLKSDQKQSKSNYEKMKVLVKINHKRTRLKRGKSESSSSSNPYTKKHRKNSDRQKIFSGIISQKDGLSQSSQSSDSDVQILAENKKSNRLKQFGLQSDASKQGQYLSKRLSKKIGESNQNAGELVQLQERLKKECKGDLGIVNPYKAFSFLNVIQKEDCPEAYEPEIVTLHKKKEEAKRQQDQLYNEIDKTLFDFDDEIDKLSDVSERYKVVAFDMIEPGSNADKHDKTIEQIQSQQQKLNEGNKMQESKKKGNQAVLTMDKVKAEMIKDLKYHDQRADDETLEDIIRSKQSKNMVLYKKKKNQKLIPGFKQDRRNVNQTGDRGQQPSQLYCQIKDANKSLSRYSRQAQSAHPGERRKDYFANKQQQQQLQSQSNNEIIVQANVEKPLSLGRPQMDAIYGNIQKVKNSNVLREQKPSLESYLSSRPMTQSLNNRGAYNNASAGSRIIQGNMNLKAPNISQYIQAKYTNNGTPFANTKNALSEAAIFSSSGFQTNINKSGGYYPIGGSNSVHMHIDRMQKYFCANIQKQTNELQAQVMNSRQQVQNLKLQQMKLLNQSIQNGDKGTNASISRRIHESFI